MIELLNMLFLQLQNVFGEELSSKEKKNFIDNKVDVFATLVSLNKNQKDFRILIEKGSVSRETLIFEFSKELVSEAIDKKYIRYGNTINDNKLFITSNGLYHYYLINNLNLNEVFISFDDSKFPDQNYSLKTQEKILCIFLILFGADCENNKLDISKQDSKTLENYFRFLKTIEEELKNNNILLGKEIGWNKGKDISFKQFITNNVDLPKTGIYHYSSGKYWLDLEKRKNVKILLDLILNLHQGNERIIANEVFYNTMWSLSNKILTNLGEIPVPLNKIVVDELRG